MIGLNLNRIENLSGGFAMSNFRMLAAMSLFALASPHLAVAAGQKRTTQKVVKATAAKIPYGVRVSGVDCSNIATRFFEVPESEPFLQKVQTKFIIASAKDEYETTANYKSRLSEIAPAVFDGANNIIISADVHLSTQFNADSGLMTVKPFHEIYSRDANEPMYSLTSLVGGADRGKYIGRNAYGTSVVVEKSSIDSVRMAFDASPDEYRTGNALSVALPAPLARIVGEKARLVMVATIASMPMFSHVDHVKPTLDDPSDTYFHEYYVPVIPRCAILVAGKAHVGTFNMFPDRNLVKPAINFSGAD